MKVRMKMVQIGIIVFICVFLVVKIQIPIAYGDPDSPLTFYSMSGDVYLYSEDSNYTTIWSALSSEHNGSSTNVMVIGQYYAGGTYHIYRSFLYFDTSSIPDNALILNATLSLYGRVDNSLDDFNVTVQNGQPTYPHEPFTHADWNKDYYSGDGGSFNTSEFTTSGYNNITLIDVAWINKTAPTKLCLRSNKEIDGITPGGNEYVSIWANEKGEGYKPKLIIHYTHLVFSGLTVDDYRCNPSQTLTFSGTIHYQGTTSTPPDGDYQVKVDLGGTQKGSTDTTLVNGQFSINDVTVESTVGSYSYKVNCTYMASQGSFDTIIVDTFTVSFTASKLNPNLNEPIDVSWTITRDFDSSEVTDFSINITRDEFLWLENYGTNSTPDVEDLEVTHVYSASGVIDNLYSLTDFAVVRVTVAWSKGGGGGGAPSGDGGAGPPIQPPVVVPSLPPLVMYGSIVLLGIVGVSALVHEARRHKDLWETTKHNPQHRERKKRDLRESFDSVEKKRRRRP